MNSTLKLELVLPCYNEADSLKQLIVRAREAAATHGLQPGEFRLVLVENGSKDNSKKVLQSLSQDSSLKDFFQIIQIDTNEGYGNGLWKGLQKTQAPWIAWSHADQQCDPADAFKAWKILLASAEPQKTLVKGKRFGRALKDRFVSFVFSLFSKYYLKLKVDEINAQPKVVHRSLLENCPNPPKDFSFDLYMLYRAQQCGYSFAEIDVLFPPRIHGLSNWANNWANRRKTIFNMIRYMKELSRQERLLQ